jgi:hypothetical protein
LGEEAGHQNKQKSVHALIIGTTMDSCKHPLKKLKS